MVGSYIVGLLNSLAVAFKFRLGFCVRPFLLLLPESLDKWKALDDCFIFGDSDSFCHFAGFGRRLDAGCSDVLSFIFSCILTYCIKLF